MRRITRTCARLVLTRQINNFVFLEGEQISSGQEDVLRRLARMKFTTIHQDFPKSVDEIDFYLESLNSKLKMIESVENHENLVFINGSPLSLLTYPKLYAEKAKILKFRDEMMKNLKFEHVFFPTDEYTIKLRIANHCLNVDPPKITLEDIPHINNVYQELTPYFHSKVWNS